MEAAGLQYLRGFAYITPMENLLRGVASAGTQVTSYPSS